MQLLIQAIWGYIWKYTAEKSQTNAAIVIIPLLSQAIWGDIWKPTLEKSQTNATNEIEQAFWKQFEHTRTKKANI